MATDQPQSDLRAGDSNRAGRLIDAFFKELDASGVDFYPQLDVKSFRSVQTILELPRDRQVAVVIEAVARQVDNERQSGRRLTDSGISTGEPSWNELQGFKQLISLLLRKRLPFQTEDLGRLVQTISAGRGFLIWQLSLGGILRALEDLCKEQGVPDCLRPNLAVLRDRLCAQPDYAETRDAVKRLDQLLGPAPAAPAESLLQTDEAWTRYLRAQLDRLEPPARTAWHALLLHCNTAVQSKPSRKWLQQVDILIAGIGPAAFATVLSGALAEIGKPGTPQIKRVYSQEFTLDPTLIHDTHSDLLRGLVWCASLVKDDNLIVSVGDAAAVCFKKIPGIGPRAPKIGNACLYALSATSSLAAVGQLSRLKTRAKHASIRKQLAKALDTAADKTGMTAAEMEEVAVPSCGLTEVGAHRLRLGDMTAVLEVPGGFKAELSWLQADGKKLKAVPASVKEAFAAGLKSLKQSEKEIAKLLPAQRDRLEQLFLLERIWSFPEFRSRYLDHPLVGILARRLIWRYSDGANACDGIWLDGQIVDDRDQTLDWLGAETGVAPWHPLACGLEQVRAWRDWLDRHQVRQPFKQAHREIYILTDAERRTDTYSNRFAAHIIRQHQFSALCQQRGWRYTLQGNWDSYNIPTLQLPQWDVRVEFWVQPLADDDEATASGVYRHLSTDQVRFYRRDEVDPIPLANVPPLVLSEVLRDVDLFVGVASVGNDPNWSDGARAGHHQDYWQSYSFGDLSTTAQTRKAVLERIVPRLKIAERCSFGDKFLIVRGDLRTYKIHLGSGNILMSPNDQYVCIVPKPSAAEVGGKVFLPFDGDNLLSIILSKVFLLAEDSKIKDPTIVSQILKR
ncbi:MAG: DUF4132 domain-containing protein [Isosphaerales bacterium]